MNTREFILSAICTFEKSSAEGLDKETIVSQFVSIYQLPDKDAYDLYDLIAEASDAVSGK